MLAADGEKFYTLGSEIWGQHEIYDRNVGKNSALKLPRGMNALWRDGGVLFAPSWK